MKATKIYRDNFVYNINTPLCDEHAKSSPASGPYAYIEKFEGDKECKHCENEEHQKHFNIIKPRSIVTKELKMELTKTVYKDYQIDIAQNDHYENYIIYVPWKAKYLENSPIFYTIEQAKDYIDQNDKKEGLK